ITFVLVLTVVTARFVHARQIEITKADGIQESLFLEIGGTQQYIQIRGEDRDNPIILVLHGGPGSPTSYYSYYWQTELEDDFTLVHWDQRGSGRTYYVSESQTTEVVTTDLLLADVDEIVTYLTNRFKQ